MNDYEFSYGDLDSMINDAAFDFNSVNDIDLSGVDLGGIDVSNINGLDLPAEFKVDPGAFSMDEIDAMLADAAGGIGDFNLDDVLGNVGGTGRTRSLGNILGDSGKADNLEENVFDFDQAAPPADFAKVSDEMIDSASKSGGQDLANTDWESLYKEGLTDEQIAKRQELMDYASERNQNFGASTDVDKSLSDMADRGTKLPSQWQKTKDGRYIMVQDDGSGIGIDEDGNSFALSQSQVQARIKSGDLNTYESGYNTATGGNKIAPGGGRSLGGGKYLTPDGKIVYTDKSGNLTTTPSGGKGGKGGNDGKGGGTSSKDNMLNKLLPLIMMMMMMNQNKGGGSSSSAVIPSLSADRKQLPYGPVSGSQARPGAGGVNYFSPTTYTQKAAGGGMMYGGGGISDLGGYSDGGRLLKGPGDGVSDSIPATIGGKQPARLATGEFVVPARIVSELGNGSTEAGAKKLYAMMDRVQKARRKTKNVAADTKAHKYLPA